MIKELKDFLKEIEGADDELEIIQAMISHAKRERL